MINQSSKAAQEELLSQPFDGEVAFDETMRRLYATDASEYQEMPLGVAWPKSPEDIRRLILWAARNRLSLIPRTAGTSLAGQCVGTGLVMDLSRHFTKILKIDTERARVIVQPGGSFSDRRRRRQTGR